ncbi:MAG: hypothetical protein RMN25_09925 [Anaerolineae bacterium]|nr:hypothetical protein [Thermoflexales bacterium]MDW8408086.1 hypothetical protein [Anaerolineae bacterium]
MLSLKPTSPPCVPSTLDLMHLSNLFRLSYWLDAEVLNRPAAPFVWWLAALGAVWALGAIIAWRARKVPADVALAQAVAGVLFALVAVGRLYQLPFLGLRVGWLLAAGIAVLPALLRIVRRARDEGVGQACWRAMAFLSPTGAGQLAWHPITLLAWAGLHLFALTVVCSVVRLPLSVAPALVVALLVPTLISFVLRSGRRDRLSVRQALTQGLVALTPLGVVYAVLALRVVVGLIARFAIGEFRVIEPFGALLNVPLTLIIMSAYGLLISVHRAAPCADTRYVRAGALALMAGVIAWSIWTALTLRTHGVSGSDPYAYAQMGVDFAERGTVFHPFPLARLTHALNIPTEPIVHVGYKLPQDVSRMATTVWPPGYAIFTGAAYKIGGEQGLYLVTPLLSWVALCAIAWMAWTFTAGLGFSDASGSRLAIAALAVFLTATSYQQIEWQMIPMADVAAQLFSVLALTLAFADHRVPVRRLRAALSGLCLGIAFDIRYTQVLIAPALALGLITSVGDDISPRPAGHALRQVIRARLPDVMTCALFACLAALPVLIYHALAFGSPVHTGSEEWVNFSLVRLPETAWRTINELLSAREFGLLAPILVVGGWVLWRRSRRAFWVLLAYWAPVFVFHVAYWPLRLRDILSLFPALSILGALGVVWMVQRLLEANRDAPTRRKMIGLVVVLIGLSFVFVLRSMDTLALPITRGFGAFGYLVREQRQSFNEIARLTPANAVIGCSLNSGPIDLYAERLTFRPANWTPDQLIAFVRAVQHEGAPVYVLEDGVELAVSLQTLREQFVLRPVARLDVPYYFAGSGSENRKVALYQVLGQR